MINHFENARAYLVQRNTRGLSNSDHLWNCYLEFKKLVYPKKFDDDLVFLWKEDFNELYNNYKKEDK